MAQVLRSDDGEDGSLTDDEEAISGGGLPLAELNRSSINDGSSRSRGLNASRRALAAALAAVVGYATLGTALLMLVLVSSEPVSSCSSATVVVLRIVPYTAAAASVIAMAVTACSIKAFRSKLLRDRDTAALVAELSKLRVVGLRKAAAIAAMDASGPGATDATARASAGLRSSLRSSSSLKDVKSRAAALDRRFSSGHSLSRASSHADVTGKAGPLPDGDEVLPAIASSMTPSLAASRAGGHTAGGSDEEPSPVTEAGPRSLSRLTRPGCGSTSPQGKGKGRHSPGAARANLKRCRRRLSAASGVSADAAARHAMLVRASASLGWVTSAWSAALGVFATMVPLLFVFAMTSEPKRPAVIAGGVAAIALANLVPTAVIARLAAAARISVAPTTLTASGLRVAKI